MALFMVNAESMADALLTRKQKGILLVKPSKDATGGALVIEPDDLQKFVTSVERRYYSHAGNILARASFMEAEKMPRKLSKQEIEEIVQTAREYLNSPEDAS
jgi:hypothetical protein